MENQRHIVTSPIHRPCPDMAGCANPNPALTAKSLQVVEQLRERFGFKTSTQRMENHREYLKELAAVMQHRDLMVGGAR